MIYLNLLLTSEEPLYVLLRMLLIFSLTVLAARLAGRATRKRWEGKLHYKFLRNIMTVIIYVLGMVLALDQIPQFDKSFTTLLTGSGIAALAISLAAQESLGNFISGMVISASKPFEVGDRVRLVGGNITGYVEDITMRHTVVRTFMNSRIIIPNSVINNEMIENSNFLEERASGFLDVIITYDSDMEKAMELMAEVTGSHPAFVDPRGPDELDQPKVVVYVRNLGVYGVELRTSVWTRSINNNFVTCSEIRHNLKLAYDHAGIKFATGVLAPPPDS